MNFFKHFFSYDSLFYINRIRLEPADTVFAAVSAGLVVLAAVIRAAMYFNRHEVRRRLMVRLWHLCLTVGVLGMVWFGARYQLIGWFGTRFAFLLLMLVGLVWLAVVVRYWLTTYRKEKIVWQHQQLKNKYLRMQK